MNAQNKSILYSVFGGLLIIVFWVYINQIKTEAQLPFWDIIDFMNETEDETTQENLEYPPEQTQQSNTTITNQNNQTPTTQAQIPPPAPIVKKPLGPYKNGTYKATSMTPWGDMGISIIVKDGKWANIRYLQIPDSPPSQYASSYLAKQALKAQNASINGVSGATYATEAFRDDLKQIIKQSKV